MAHPRCLPVALSRCDLLKGSYIVEPNRSYYPGYGAYLEGCIAFVTGLSHPFYLSRYQAAEEAGFANEVDDLSDAIAAYTAEASRKGLHHG